MTKSITCILIAEQNNAIYSSLKGAIDAMAERMRIKRFDSFDSYLSEAGKLDFHLLVVFEAIDKLSEIETISNKNQSKAMLCFLVENLMHYEKIVGNHCFLLPSQFSGYVNQYVSHVHELSERLKLEFEKSNRIIELQKKQLEKIRFEVDRFAYSVSHDLRAPLTSVLGLAYLLDSALKDDEQRKYIMLMKESIQRLDNTIRDIVAYAQNSRTKITLTEVSLQELTDSILETLSYLNTDDLNIRSCVEVHDPGVFIQDRSRLQIVLQSLIANAIRYRDPARALHIQVVSRIKGRKVEICVKDNGLGIKEEHMTKIFDMFYRTNDQSTGSGLGLYIVRETLHNLKGKIEVKSVIHQGSEFKITIPLRTIKRTVLV